MAENEYLDLGHRNSARWRHWGKLIGDGASDEDVAREGVSYLTRTFQNLAKNDHFPMAELIAAASGEDGDIREIVRRRGPHDYSRLFELSAGQGLDRLGTVENVLEMTCDRFLHQIGMKVVESKNWPDFQQYSDACYRWKALMCDAIHRLAKRLSENPNEPPRMPAISAPQREAERRKLNRLSLLPR